MILMLHWQENRKSVTIRLIQNLEDRQDNLIQLKQEDKQCIVECKVLVIGLEDRVKDWINHHLRQYKCGSLRHNQYKCGSLTP